MRNADWKGRFQEKWRWRFPFRWTNEFGRVCYQTDALGRTRARWWEWEKP